MRPAGVPEQDDFTGAGIPVQELPENQDPDVAFMVDGLTGAKTPLGEQPESTPRVQSSSAEEDVMGGAPSESDPMSVDQAHEAKPEPVDGDGDGMVRDGKEDMRPKTGPGSRGPYKKTRRLP